jgi:hypothetical protein
MDKSIVPTILSLLGAFLISINYNFYGFVIWIVSNILWVIYFKQTKQYNPMVLFSIYLITSVIGVINNWPSF